MTTAPELKPTQHARKTAYTPRPLPVWLQAGMVVLLLVQGVQTAAHWYHNATSPARSVTATHASPDAAPQAGFAYYYQPERLSSAGPQARLASSQQESYVKCT